MKKLLAILLVLCSATFAQKSKLIISVSGELEIDMADVLMDGISYGLKNNDKYQILINDRQFKETLKKEWKKGNISDDRIIALAKNAGADYLCFTKIKSVKGLKGKQVTASVYDLSTMSYTDQMGMKTIKSDFSDLEDLTNIILSVVDDMLGTSNKTNRVEPKVVKVEPKVVKKEPETGCKGQEQKSVAIFNTVDDGEPPIEFAELSHLTDIFRSAVLNVLPPQCYTMMTLETMIKRLGGVEKAKMAAMKASDLAELGRRMNADYVAQARIGRFQKNMTIRLELYKSNDLSLEGYLTGSSKDISGLHSIIDSQASILFKRLLNVSK